MYPSIDELKSAADPKRLLEVRRSFRSNLVPFLVFLLSLLAVIVLSQAFDDGLLPASWPLIGGLGVRWAGIIPAIILLEIFRRYHDDLYVFDAERITHYEGRLSLTSSVPSLKYSDIKALTVEQNLVGRLFDYGDVLLDSSAQDGAELTVTGVRSPLQLAYLIEELRAISNQLAAQQSPTQQSPAESPGSNNPPAR